MLLNHSIISSLCNLRSRTLSQLLSPLSSYSPMKLTVLTLHAIAMFVVVSQTALAQVVEHPQVICSSRLSGLEKAKCLVEQRNEILRQLGRLPPAASSSSESSESSASSPAPVITTQASSSSIQPRSCSRMKDREKALCLVEQRKEILRQLAAIRPPVGSIVTVPVPRALAKTNCTRMRNPAERVRCHSGNRVGPSSSSSASQ